VVEEQVYLKPVAAPQLTWFDQLGRDAHRLLALTVLCGSLSRVEAIMALRWTPDRLEPVLGRLVGAGLITQDEQRDRWRVRGAVWRQVTELLRHRHELIGEQP
jgi:hypothetical protein